MSQQAKVPEGGSWFVRFKHGNAEWIEGSFKTEDEAREHARLSTEHGYGAPNYDLRTIRLERPDMALVVQRLAEWIEKNCEGVQVYRDTGLVVA